MLSDTDQAAAAFNATLRPPQLGKTVRTGSGLWTGAKEIRVSGRAFCRWMTKTYCNFMAIDHEPMSLDFVQHSFDKPSERAIRFYVYAAVDLKIKTDVNRLEALELSDADGTMVFYLCFFGMHFLVANVDLKSAATVEFGETGVISTGNLMERPNIIEHVEPLGHGIKLPTRRVMFEW